MYSFHSVPVGGFLNTRIEFSKLKQICSVLLSVGEPLFMDPLFGISANDAGVFYILQTSSLIALTL